MTQNTILLPRYYPVACHTDYITQGSTFVAINGTKENGSIYIRTALERGAQKIVLERSTVLSPDITCAITQAGAELIYVDNSRQALAQLSAQALDWPATKLKIFAITGTKGKTTTAFLLEHIMRTAGYKTALLSTVKNKILDHEFPTQLTTQHPDYLHVFFNTCVQAHIDIVIMEVAAQALSLYRVDGIRFDGGIFTNFSTEHGEFYASQYEYFNAKCSLFDQLKPGSPAVFNSDDAAVQTLLKRQFNVPLSTVSFGFTPEATLSAHTITSSLDGITCTLSTYNKQEYTISCPALIGTFNIANILSAWGLAHAYGITPDILYTALATFNGIPGRLTTHDSICLPNGARAFIDYAHNPSSYESVLSALRPLTSHLIAVFGCGGDRDRSKRSLMGNIAAQWCDHLIITSDNPRSEDPNAIIKDICAGIPVPYLPNVTCEPDRTAAIYTAYQKSRFNSILILLGKGPDEYQLINDKKIPFSERSILSSLAAL